MRNSKICKSLQNNNQGTNERIAVTHKESGDINQACLDEPLVWPGSLGDIQPRNEQRSNYPENLKHWRGSLGEI